MFYRKVLQHFFIFFTYQLVDIWFASAYYVFETGKARAFPAGLKMKASAGNSASRATAICAGSYPCERTDQGGCQGTVRFFFSIDFSACPKPQKVGIVLRFYQKHFFCLFNSYSNLNDQGSQTDQMDNEGVLKGGFLPLQGCGGKNIVF